MSDFIITIQRGDYEFYKRNGRRYLRFGEPFLDTKHSKLYIGSEYKDKPYMIDLNAAPITPMNMGRIVVNSPRLNVESMAKNLYDDWQEFIEWKRNKEFENEQQNLSVSK